MAKKTFKRSNFNNLEKRKIEWTDGYQHYTAIVAGFDPDLGMTLVNARDRTHNLTCVKTSFSMNNIHGEGQWDKANSPEDVHMMRVAAMLIRRGKYTCAEMVTLTDRGQAAGHNTESSNCAFSQ